MTRNHGERAKCKQQGRACTFEQTEVAFDPDNFPPGHRVHKTTTHPEEVTLSTQDRHNGIQSQ